MSAVQLPANGWRPRWYQKAAWDSWEGGCRRQLLGWHRRAGKDELNLNQHAVAAHTRIGTYWHMLPEYAQARKAIWDAVNPLTGRRRIDEAFPLSLRASTRDNDMFIRFKSGSTWQVVGSDNYNALVGTPPIGITLSEWALANPTAWGYLSPILAENGGWASFISTPRGANHFKRMHDAFKGHKDWFVEVLGVQNTKAISREAVEAQRAEYRSLFGDEIADMLIEQEFYCSWAGAMVGAILARQVDRAEKEGRVSDAVEYDPAGAPVDVSSDIGFHDTAAWWFWQPHHKGYRLLKYVGASGLDADDWAAEIKKILGDRGWELGRIHLPHDAKPKTFQSKRSSMERFLSAFGASHVAPVPMTKHGDQINAARTLMASCSFNATECADGLDGLRAWQFEWNGDTRSFSKDFKHDFASHPAQAYAYGCQVFKMTRAPEKRDEPRHVEVGVEAGARGLNPRQMTLEDLWATLRKNDGGRI